MRPQYSLLMLFALLSALTGGHAAGDPSAPQNIFVPFASKLTAAAPAWTKPGKVFIVIGEPDYEIYDGSQPHDEAKPPAQVDLTTPEGIASANGCKAVWSGRILAIAPSTMSVLSQDPRLYDVPISQLSVAHPIEFFMGSLTKQQFIQLSTTGLGMDDLSPDQQVMFKAMMPSPFQLVPASFIETFMTQEDMKEQTANPQAFTDKLEKQQKAFNDALTVVPSPTVLKEVRLHAYLKCQYALDAPTGGSFGFNASKAQSESTGTNRLTLQDDYPSTQSNSSNPLQALLISKKASEVKPSDLDYHRHELTTLVTLNKDDTVAALVSKIASATHLDLYADERYGALPVTMAGDLTKGESASDLMQAIAICVNGTWRHVGRSYVLTDDLVGLATRQQFLKDVVQNWSNKISDAGGKVGMQINTYEWTKVLNTFPGDSTELSKDRLMAITNGGEYGDTKWAALPPGIQSALLNEIKSDGESDGNSGTMNSIVSSIAPDKTVSVSLSIQLALELKGTGIMRFSEFTVNSQQPGNRSYPTSTDKIAMSEPIRALLCAPKTVDEVRQVIDMMPALGLNTLYLDVFANGRTYFPNDGIRPESLGAASVLPAAIAEGALHNIPVYAVIDTFCWRKDGDSAVPAPFPAGYSEDVNVNGEPAYRGVNRRIAQNAIPSDIDAGDFYFWSKEDSWVSPLDSKVQAVLPILVKELAGTKGVAGLVFQDTAPPGYNGTQQYQSLGADLDLGYTNDNRVAFLKANGIDPVDYSTIDQANMWDPYSGWQESFRLRVGSFGANGQGTTGDSWTKYRNDADLGVLKQCYLAAQTANPNLPLLMRERLSGLSFDPWKDPNSVDQIASLDSSKNPFGYVNQSTVLDVQIGPLTASNSGSVSWLVNSTCNEFGGGKAGGVALDIESGAIDQNVPQMLQNLSKYLPPK